MPVIHQGEAFIGLVYGAFSDIDFASENFLFVGISTWFKVDEAIFVTEDAVDKFEIFMLQLLHQLWHMMLIKVDIILAADLRALYHIQLCLFITPGKQMHLLGVHMIIRQQQIVQPL